MNSKVKFGGTVEEQNELATLVSIGEKTATSSLFELKIERELSCIGDIWEINNGLDQQLCRVQVISVEVVKFGDVTEEFAKAEGDGTFQNWLDIHTRYYSLLLEQHNKKLTKDTLLECVYFEKIY